MKKPHRTGGFFPVTSTLLVLLAGGNGVQQWARTTVVAANRESQLHVEKQDQAIAQPRSDVLPIVLGLAVVGLGLILSFVVFW